MEEYTTKLDENGKIILPEEFRKRYSIFPGDELIIRVRDYKVTENENAATWEIFITSAKNEFVDEL